MPMPVVVVAAAAPPTTAPLRKSRRPRPSSFMRSSRCWAARSIAGDQSCNENAPFAPARQGPRRGTSFHFDPRRLDDRPPFLDLSLVERIERFRRQFLARENILRDVGQFL